MIVEVNGRITELKSIALHSCCMGKCLHGDFKKKTKMSNSLSHLKENPQILKERKKKKKSGRILGLAGRTGAAVSDLKFDLCIKFFYGICSDMSQCTH